VRVRRELVDDAPVAVVMESGDGAARNALLDEGRRIVQQPLVSEQRPQQVHGDSSVCDDDGEPQRVHLDQVCETGQEPLRRSF
jgi:hypothetical protein